MGPASTAAHLFYNHVSKPISVIDFKEAIDATCRRVRFPSLTWSRQRMPLLAISGGVDSMALAYLWSEFFLTFPTYKISDFHIYSPTAVIVNHDLRPNSEEEAEAVASQCRKMGLKTVVRVIRWDKLKKDGINVRPSNMESIARTERYRLLGDTCRIQKSPSLFTAHHEDDQYETVLMRLLNDHGYRGLTGMRPANDVPECYGEYDVHKSGLLSDLRSSDVMVKFDPSNTQTRRLRNHMRDFYSQRSNDELEQWSYIDQLHFHKGTVPKEPETNYRPHLTPLEGEDGGVVLYRPLLHFSKDRLMATCEKNKVPWFEDHTNKDKTLTMRNAVRHLVQNHKLPVALQKPAILRLCDNANRRSELEENEARRMLIREAVIQDFDSCTGTLVIEAPSYKPKNRRLRRRHDDARTEARRPHRSLVAALAVRRLMEYVSPEEHLPPLSQLQKVAGRLFPGLNPDLQEASERPTTFSTGSVLFEPIVKGHSVSWYLSRAPYPGREPLPGYYVDWRIRKHAMDPVIGEPGLQLVPKCHITHWRHFIYYKLWDGRFWIRVGSKALTRFYVMPYMHENAKAFRESLPRHDRAYLEKVLKYYAPGKVRTTLPAIYRMRDQDARAPVPRAKMEMVALPSLDIKQPDLDEYLTYDIAYKKWDPSLIGLKKRRAQPKLRGYQATISKSRARRTARQRKTIRRWRERVPPLEPVEYESVESAWL